MDDKPTGPSIRAWETARAFAAAGHSVTAVATALAAYTRDGINVVPRSRYRISNELWRHDVVHGANLPPYALTTLAARRCLRIADLYDPLDVELASATGRGSRFLRDSALANRRMHIRWSDLIISANARQNDRLLHELRSGIRPHGEPETLVIPMGLPAPPPSSHGHPLRERFPAIGADDPLILWWGLIWRWLDPHTAIDAIARLATRRPNVRLVFTAGRPGNLEANAHNATEEARAHAQHLGLLDRNIFFLDEWVPYEDRHRYLRDATLGITLPGHSDEAFLAARFRYSDYLWSGLPCVLGTGDESSAELASAGAAWMVPPADPVATAATIDRLLDDPHLLVCARDACQVIADRYRWSSLLAPLVARAEQMALRSHRTKTLHIASDAGRYYGRRLVEVSLLPRLGN